MFEEVLFNHIVDNFEVSGFDITIGFGEVPEETLAPYIVQYNLDTDGDRRTLNNSDNFTDGEAFIQWNIYCTDPSNAFYLKQRLMSFIAELKYISLNGLNYMIELNQHSSSPSGSDQNTGLFVEVVAREITYSKK